MQIRSSIIAATIAIALTVTAPTSFAAKVSPIEEMQARAEIENLLAKAVFAYDQHDADAFADCFTPDGEVQTVASALHPEGGATFKGRERVKYFAVKNATGGAGGPPGGAGAGGPPGAAPGAAGAGGPPAGFAGGAPGAAAGVAPAASTAPLPATAGLTAGFAARHLVTSNYIKIIDSTHAIHVGYHAMMGGKVGSYSVFAIGNYDDHLVKYQGKWLLQTRKNHYEPIKIEE